MSPKDNFKKSSDDTRFLKSCTETIYCWKKTWVMLVENEAIFLCSAEVTKGGWKKKSYQEGSVECGKWLATKWCKKMMRKLRRRERQNLETAKGRHQNRSNEKENKSKWKEQSTLKSNWNNFSIYKKNRIKYIHNS